MSFTIIIPARYASTRLPGKALIEIAGKPMLQWVYEKAQQTQAKKIIIATDDARVEAAAKQFTDAVVMTSADHVSGTERLQEVASLLQLADDEIVVNVQGDEPLIPPAFIHQVAKACIDFPQADIATLSAPLVTLEDIFNPNLVKVVCDHQSHALYFSRAAIPWQRDAFPHHYEAQYSAWQRHIGIYAYRVSLLHEFVRWPVAPIEMIERLEQLRALYYGKCIHVTSVDHTPDPGVDTPEDLVRVQQLLLSTAS